MRRMVVLVAWSAALVGAATACSQQGGAATAPTTSASSSPSSTSVPRLPATRAAYSAALNDALVVPMGQDDRCVSGRLIDAIGVERLHALALEPEDVPTPEGLRAVAPTGHERAALERVAAAALDTCGTTRKVLAPGLEGLGLSDPAPHVECVAQRMHPLLASTLFEQWAGSEATSLTTEAEHALDQSMFRCPELQLALVDKGAGLAGKVLTAKQRTCMREGFEELAGRQTDLGRGDLRGVVRRCL
ncbi:MAG: hypothetical protein U0P45_00965 [Acidimicrobiales bacterium]